MSSKPLDHSDEPEIDEVEAALSHLETTLEGRSTDKILVCRRFKNSVACFTSFYAIMHFPKALPPTNPI